MNYQFRAIYAANNYFNELIGSKIEWKGLKLRKVMEKSQKKKIIIFQRSPIQVLTGLDAASLWLTKWAWKKVGFLLITFFPIKIEWKWRHFCNRTKKLVHTMYWISQKISSCLQTAIFYVKYQKKPQFSPKGLVKFFYLLCLLITHI